MITALLSLVFVACLLHGWLPQPLPLAVALGVAVFIYLNNRHKHTEYVAIDILAQASKLKPMNAMWKVVTLLLLMAVCVASPCPVTGLFLLVSMPVIAVAAGGCKLSEYIGVLALPTSFLMVGGLALLFEAVPAGGVADPVLALEAWGWLRLTVSVESQRRALMVVTRALGAASCLVMIGMCTPMPDVIGVLRRLGCPGLVIDLSYLTYRYIFILLAMHRDMQDAARSRLGFNGYRASLRSTAAIFSNLLARSHHLASMNYDAMESRCYDGGIGFLEHRRPVLWQQAVGCLLLLGATAASVALPLLTAA
jgi:cobalt/nickel transport system permease protein